MKRHWLACALTVTVLAGCGDFDIPNYNAGSLEGLESNPTATTLATAAHGMLYVSREQEEFYIIILGSMGREGYSLHPSDAGWRRNDHRCRTQPSDVRQRIDDVHVERLGHRPPRRHVDARRR